MDIVTPVLGAVQIVLEAVKRGAEVRNEALRAFDDLEDVFSDVEIFLATFQQENSVIEQAVTLVVAVLEVVERGIKFFTRPGCKYLPDPSRRHCGSPPSDKQWAVARGLKSIAKGKDYEASLLESLSAITSRSKTLMAWAVKTHIRDFARFTSTNRILPLSHLISDNPLSRFPCDTANSPTDTQQPRTHCRQGRPRLFEGG